MTLPKFDVLQPGTVNEACEMLGEHSSQAAVLAGGTDILVDIRKPIIPAHLPRCKGCAPEGGVLGKMDKTPEILISLSRIPELRGIYKSKNGEIIIGACTTISEICESVLVRERLTALAEGGDNLGSPLVRNRGTIGGNICSARPAADCLIPAMALKAEVELVSVEGARTVPIEEFVIGPGKTVLEPHEILTKVIFPIQFPRMGSATVKLANRKALEIAVVNVSSVLSFDEEGIISAARIVMGAVGPVPIVAKAAADFLLGKEPSEKLFDRAGEIAAGECRPITDHRGSALYRVEMVRVLVRRTLERILNTEY